ncbi:bestrophin family ion channel [Trichocoleus sp. DQ-U1]|uniref:bestrophin family protein n=1 Tax=Trichocoleus sp. DQ-U1 TaxID=2933926 RepID=UPI0032996398
MTIENKNWFAIALQLRGSVAPTIFPRVLLCGGFGFFVSILDYFKLPIAGNLLDNLVTNVVYNLVLGLLLVFRTNTAYERFWEGRKSWGLLVVNVRNLARQIQVSVAERESTDREDKATAMRLLGAFAIATKLQLRQEALNDELEEIVTPSQFLQLKSVKNPPLKIAFWIGDYLQQQHERNSLNNNQLAAMNGLLDQMVEALTGCERILKTPIPLAYAIYLKRLLLIYGFALPFQLVDTSGWWTGLVVGIISFILFGIEEIGNEIENPFGRDPNDLPLDDICTTIIENLEDLTKIPEQSLGEILAPQV